MVKKFISNSVLLICFTLTGINQARAQTHEANLAWLSNEQAAERNTVVLNNAGEILPLVDVTKKMACIDLGFSHSTVFDSLLNKYQQADHFNGNTYAHNSNLGALLDDLKFYQTLILEVSDVSVFDERVFNFIREAGKQKQVIIALFGDARSLVKLNSLPYPIVWCQNHNPEGAAVVAQVIFGGIAINNSLKQNYGASFNAGTGYATKKTRLGYTVPEATGINIDDLSKIESIANEAIKANATPSAVVLVVKSGQVIYNRAFGKPTYLAGRNTRINDIYDLASITKTAATTPAVMRLYETGQLSLDSTLSTYIGRSRGLDKANITLRELMLHQAGLIPFIPFYQQLAPKDYSREASEEYNTRVADHYYLRKNYYAEVMWPQMLRSPLQTRGKYVYSDLSMYLMKEVVETLSQKPLEYYVAEQFYRPLGMQTAGYKPLDRFPAEQIIPTEEDRVFRKTTLQGDVHDQGAAMLGGVAGHAGLFATANDLAIFYQLLLNKGNYGGSRYFKPTTVELFTSRQSEVSRRGLGFDRADPDVNKQYPSWLVSPETFGHTGYTGTCVWADPVNGLIYIFLSNRTYPQVTDRLSNLKIRPRIQDVIYEAMIKGRNK
ncbi:MAG: serine hydrolase domain-containing protein [Sphingobacteriaceae bacterium]